MSPGPSMSLVGVTPNGGRLLPGDESARRLPKEALCQQSAEAHAGRMQVLCVNQPVMLVNAYTGCIRFTGIPRVER